jgi:outer membrane receptor protein involved in Fe transport
VLGNLGAQYKHNDNVNITFGSEFYNDLARSHDDGSLFYEDKKSVSYNNIAFFTQGLFETPWVNITLGARYDNHSKYDAVFVPRVGLTKVWSKWHAKILYSNAFRAPSIENISLSEEQSIKPEKTTVIEAEAGYQVSDNWVVSANLFDIGTKTPIYYNYLDGSEIYANGKRAGTTGVELESKLKEKNVSLSVNYSFYTAALHSQIETYKVVGDEKSLLAFANHKLAFIGNVRMFKDLNFNVSGVFLGSRHGFIAGSPTDAPAKIGSTLLLNAMLRYENLLTKGLSVSLGVNNITNSNPMFIQPYNSGHTPLPTPKTQLQLKLGYTFTR